MKELERYLAEKTRLLKRVLTETERQRELIAQRDLEGLASSIDDRQAVMDEIDALDGSIRMGRGASSGAGYIESARKEIETILAEIIGKDAENRKNAGAFAGTLMTGIRETNIEKSLLAYQAAPVSGSRFVNRKG